MLQMLWNMVVMVNQLESTKISVLKEISTILVHEKNADLLLKKVLSLLDREMGMSRATFTIRHGSELRIEASRGLDEAEIERGFYHIGEGITGHVAETGRPHIIPDIRTDKRFLNRTRSRDAHDAVAFICVPVIRKEEVIGTLSIDRKLEPESELQRDAAFLEIVGNIIADAVEVCRREHEERKSLLDENRKLRKLIHPNPGELVGNCREMLEIYDAARQIAASDATVLIRGSTGTGKEVLARAILGMSNRKNKPFIALNCAAIPENLLESELFGYEKGAFTGAVSQRIGRAEAADGGTLFLDEIGDLSLPLQAKLLRFIQEKTFSRLGSNEEIHSNVRFIAATSRNLEDLMTKKLFREDLYYRLNVFPILMPDLKNRKSDILLLAEHFFARLNVKYKKKMMRFSPEVIEMLLSYSWPGNVRELENCMEHAVLTAAGDCIMPIDLPPSLRSAELKTPNSFSTGHEVGGTLKAIMKDYEKKVVAAVLERNHGNISAMGRELGLSPRMAHYKLETLGLRSSNSSDHSESAQ